MSANEAGYWSVYSNSGTDLSKVHTQQSTLILLLHSSSSSKSMALRNPKPPPISSTILFILSLILLLFIFTLFSPSPSLSSSFITPKSHLFSPSSSSIEYSFVSSLEIFFTTKGKFENVVKQFKGNDDVGIVQNLDKLIWDNEFERIYDKDSIFPVSLPVKVYVYDMPDKFTYDLLWLFHNSYRETSNLTSNGSPVHRLIEQHSIDYWLWADLIAPESERPLKKLVVRVDRQEEADLFYIPFFTTISFFLLEKQQCKALYRVKL
ncbi:hypothetical protein Leryth_000247 [Lithospermum erythrorhizon]|nr:hypothetical protein Leryth_000247 [Lithospermum erythrorhizon]